MEEIPEKSAPPADIGAAGLTYIFGPSYSCNILTGLHPPPDRIPVYWRLYKDNCDVLIKVLHIPTVEPLVLQAAEQLDCISKGVETLMFATYFSVVVSLSPGACMEILGGEKSHLLCTYKFAMEQALTQARLLETEEMIVLQAFVIYLIGLRTQCSIRLMWTLTALAVRLAQNAGIHRDGSHFNLSPFTVEMRRRLWWCLCVLDCRASEDSGYDAAIPREGADTQLPLNVNDSDLFPSMTALPEPKSGLTEMTFSVVRFDATRTFRRLQYAQAGTIGRCGKFHASQSITEKSQLILEHQERLQELFLKHRNPSNPFCWYVEAISGIVITKMWLVAYHPYLRRESCTALSQDTRNSLFIGSISILETWLRLNNEVQTRKWKWLCETYIQWYAITFVLTELCIRTQGELVERAWKAIYAALQLGSRAWRVPSVSSQIHEAEFGQYLDLDETHDNEYKPLNRLLRKARAARDREISLDWNGDCGVIGDTMRSTLNTSNAVPVLDESLDPHSVRFNDYGLEVQVSMPDACPPHQLPEIYPGTFNTRYPTFDGEASNWISWPEFLE